MMKYLHFLPDTTKMLRVPSTGTVDLGIPGCPRIKWRATTWNFQIQNPPNLPIALFPGQIVTVVGLKGIELLIQV